MTAIAPPHRPASSRPAKHDGRHARSVSSRAKIVTAMLDIVGGGDVQPSAAKVADTAGVGLRTVFRHFDDMETLYREMSEAVEAKVMPLILTPFITADWRSRVREMAERRAMIFEAILPYRISASLKRFQSSFLMHDYQRMLRMERGTIDAVLPTELLADPVRLNMIYAVLSFQCWRGLRHDQELSVNAARNSFVALTEAVLVSLDD
ncbi:MAG: TetR/AcrR family transcriptional regulator [Sphingomonas sp.]